MAKDTLCWRCARSCDKTCSWAADFIPVDGWQADYWEKNGSYCVNYCPEFTPDSVNSRCTDMDEKGALALMERILEELHDDYVKCPRLQPDIDKWIRGRGAALCMFEDPEAVIQKLKRDYMAYQRHRANRTMV